MEPGTGHHVRNEANGVNLGHGWRFTRRTLGGALLGGLTSVRVGFTETARGEPVIPTAEPDGPDHLPRCRIKVLDTEISYVDAGRGEQGVGAASDSDGSQRMIRTGVKQRRSRIFCNQCFTRSPARIHAFVAIS